MYKNWKIKKWETPFSSVKSLTMVSLVDKGSLKILLEASREKGRPRWEVAFKRVPAYRNILEEYRLSLWEYLDKTSQRCGNTFEVVDSSWISELAKQEALLLFKNEKLHHYVIATEDDVLEVLSDEEPRVKFHGFVGDKAERVGKSEVYYNSFDRDKMESIIDERKNKIRNLYSWEREILDKLLEQNFFGRDQIRAQLSNCKVSILDDEGSIKFHLKEDIPVADIKKRIPIEAQVSDEDGIMIHILLHIVDGLISESEIFKDDSSSIKNLKIKDLVFLISF